MRQRKTKHGARVGFLQRSLEHRDFDSNGYPNLDSDNRGDARSRRNDRTCQQESCHAGGRFQGGSQRLGAGTDRVEAGRRHEDYRGRREPGARSGCNGRRHTCDSIAGGRSPARRSRRRNAHSEFIGGGIIGGAG